MKYRRFRKMLFLFLPLKRLFSYSDHNKMGT